MKRLTTDAPRDNVETALNLFYIKDHETWVRGGGPAPEYKDVSLYDFTRLVAKAHIPDVELPSDNDNLSMMMGEWLFDDPDTAEGIIALLYTAAWSCAEIRNKLKAYEDTGLTPEDLKPGLNAAVRKKLACEYFGLSTSQVSHIEELVQADKDGKLEVLPIGVGTDVFALRSGMPWCAPITACSVKSIVFHSPVNGSRMYILAEVKAERGLHIRFSPEDIGRTVFFTREEAEKALEEAANHDEV